MEMRHLRAFLAVAEELHFTRAAARLHVAQPAVSAAIRELEEEVEARLFERTRRQVQLTPAGEHFRAEAQAALAALERATLAARRAAAGETGRVVLHFTTLACFSSLPQAVVAFRAERPDVQLLMEQRGTLEQLESLRAGRCDLAVTVMPGDVKDLAAEPLTRVPLVAILPESHAKATSRGVAFREIAQEPMLILPERTEPAMHAAYRALCREAGVEPRIELELDQIDAVLSFVAVGLGVSLAPASIARLRLPGVAYVPLCPEIPAGVTVVWNPEHLGPAAAALLSKLLEGRDC